MKFSTAATLICCALAALLWCGVPAAHAGCPVRAEKDAKNALQQEKKCLALLAAIAGGGRETEVLLTEPGTATSIMPGKGLEKPRPWSDEERRAFDAARVDKDLPPPAGVWK